MNPPQPEADGEGELQKLATEFADDVTEIRYFKTWRNCTPTEQAQMMAATVELAQHIQRVIAAHDQARDAQQLAAVLERRPGKIDEPEGWDMAFNQKPENIPRCCPGDDIAYGYNAAVNQYDSVVRSVLGNNSKGDI